MPFDQPFFSPGLFVNPYTVYQRLRTEDAVHWCDPWTAGSHHDTIAALILIHCSFLSVITHKISNRLANVNLRTKTMIEMRCELRATWMVALAVLLLLRDTMGAPLDKLDVRNMQDWSVVVADTAIESEKYAAEEFRDFFAQATGHRLPIHSDSASKTKNIFIGASDSLNTSNLAHAVDREYAEEELRIVIGLDNIAIVGGQPRGVLFGVYQFLEDAMGMRFLAKNFTHVPQYVSGDEDLRRGQLKPMDYSYNPPIDCRFVSFRDLQDKTGQFAARLRTNGRWSGDGNPSGEWRKKVGGHNRKGLILHNMDGLDRLLAERSPRVFRSWQGRQAASQYPAVLFPSPCGPTHDRKSAGRPERLRP